MTFQRRSPSRRIWLPGDDPRGPLFHFVGRTGADGLTDDVSGNGLLGTPSGGVGFRKGPAGESADFNIDRAGVVTLNESASVQDLVNLTAVVRYRSRSPGDSNAGRLFTLTGADVYTQTYLNATPALNWRIEYTDGIATWRTTDPLPHDLVHTLVITHNRADPTQSPSVYLDGVALSVSVITARTGVLLDESDGVITIGDLVSVTRNMDGEVYELKWFNSILGASDRRAEYLEAAVRPAQLATRYAFPETPAPSGVQAGPWYVGSGTLDWADNGTRRRLVCATAGWAWVPSDQAYGAWYCRLTRDNGANETAFMLTASERQARNGADQNGYELVLASDESVQLRRRTNGAVANTIINSGANTVDAGTYDILVSRESSSGLWGLYIRGPGYVNWTQIGALTADTTHTTSDYMVAEPDASDEVVDVLWFPEGYTLDPTSDDIPALAA